MAIRQTPVWSTLSAASRCIGKDEPVIIVSTTEWSAFAPYYLKRRAFMAALFDKPVDIQPLLNTGYFKRHGFGGSWLRATVPEFPIWPLASRAGGKQCGRSPCAHPRHVMLCIDSQMIDVPLSPLTIEKWRVPKPGAMRPHERFDLVPNKHFGSKLQRSIERGYYSHHSLSRASWLIIPSVMVADLTGGYSRFQVTAELLSGWLSPKLACAARALGSRSHVGAGPLRRIQFRGGQESAPQTGTI